MRAFWKRYYYRYLESFVSFLTPPDNHNYVTVSDVLGNVRDIQLFLREMKKTLANDGRIVVTQHNALWEPVLRLAFWLGLRDGPVEQNWLTMGDLKNFSYLAGFEMVKSGTKMIMPVYIPLLSAFLNRFLANLWPFSHLGLFHYLVLRKPEPRLPGRQPSLSIIVPARNEAGTIEKIAQELSPPGSFTEIIFVEGN